MELITIMIAVGFITVVGVAVFVFNKAENFIDNYGKNHPEELDSSHHGEEVDKNE
jgi:hypothetical protein|tara:strand:- start:475 stop:639 length:165 start_codon:yes stop_codon:yes gene_type:complete